MQSTQTNEINETVQIEGQPVQVILVPTGRRDDTYFFKDVPGVEAVDIIRALRDQAVDTWLLMYPKHQREKALNFALTINHI